MIQTGLSYSILTLFLIYSKLSNNCVGRKNDGICLCNITLWCFASYADMVNWELNLHETHFNKKSYFYHYYLPYKVSICENAWILGKFFHFVVHKWYRNVTEIQKITFFHSSRNFRKLELCMVNNSDKSKVFC